MKYDQIKKVHLVYKTHLDVGYTNLGSTVINQYLNEFIPRSVDIALDLNTETNKKFIWTLGSYLIDLYLKKGSPEQVEKIEEAIRKGYIRWHGLSCTTYTELMDESVFNYNLSISKKLDAKYGVETIASKMTDVPGHTIAIVGYLADKGVQYLHVGVNASSKIPEVPEVFVWHHEGKEIIVHYSASYGLPLIIDGFDEVLEFAHTGDNSGPQSKEVIEEEIARVQAIYPNAIVEASTLDDFARSLLTIKDRLPVVEEEIGDTWIHGVGTDPVNVAHYKALVELGKKWVEEDKIDVDSETYDEFMSNLMMIAEHTWGLDFKKYLADFKNWSKLDFQKAREEDATTLEYLTERNAHMLGVLTYDINKYRKGNFQGSYKFFESSHDEQRQYIKNAVDVLPLELQEEAKAAILDLVPVKKEVEGERIYPCVQFNVNGWEVKIDGNGSIYYLMKDGKVWNDGKRIGLFEYEVFDFINCTTHYHTYNREFMNTCGWAEPDFSKPGLEFVEDLKNRCYSFGAGEMAKKDNEVTINLYGDTDAVKRYGSPRCAQITYVFMEEEIQIQLDWFEKDANKIPETLWFHVNFDVTNPYRWNMQKMSKMISPLDVVKGGNRKQHAVEKLIYNGADGYIEVENLHSPLVSIGGRNIYEADEKVNELSNGFYYALFNNRWGTNFKMWCEDDCRFRYIIRFKQNQVK